MVPPVHGAISVAQAVSGEAPERSPPDEDDDGHRSDRKDVLGAALGIVPHGAARKLSTRALVVRPRTT